MQIAYHATHSRPEGAFVDSQRASDFLFSCQSLVPEGVQADLIIKLRTLGQAATQCVTSDGDESPG